MTSRLILNLKQVARSHSGDYDVETPDEMQFALCPFIANLGAPLRSASEQGSVPNMNGVQVEEHEL